MNAIDKMLSRFNAVYGAPIHSGDLEVFVAEYHRALAFYANDEKILTAAANRVIDEQDRPFWPTPGAILKAIAKVVQLHSETKPRQYDTAPRGNHVPLTDEQRAEVERLVQAVRSAAAGNRVSLPPAKLPDVSRPAFDEVQRTSGNEFHQHPRGLSPRSRAMAGEGDI